MHFIVLAVSHSHMTCFDQQNVVLDFLAPFTRFPAIMETCIIWFLRQSELLSNGDEQSQSSDLQEVYGSLLRTKLKHLGCLLLQHHLAIPN